MKNELTNNGKRLSIKLKETDIQKLKEKNEMLIEVNKDKNKTKNDLKYIHISVKEEEKYTSMVTCKSCGFSEAIKISRKVAVQNAECPECGQEKLTRGSNI